MPECSGMAPERFEPLGYTLLPMALRWTALWLFALALVGGCGPSTSGVATVDASIKQDLLRGVGQIRTTYDRKKLDAELARILASLRRARGSTVRARRARDLAIQGFELTQKGVRSQLDFSENDSGNVAAATRDARTGRPLLYARRESVTRGRGGAQDQIGKLNEH